MGRACCTLILTVKRNWGFYTHNIMSVMLAICLVSNVVFAIPPEDLADRLSVVLTSLLTAVAFKLVVEENIPKLSYSTLLDKYLNGLFAVLVVMSISNCAENIAYRFHTEFFEDHQMGIMGTSFFVVSVMWLFAHVYFGFLVHSAIQRTNVELRGLKTLTEFQKEVDSIVKRTSTLHAHSDDKPF